MIYLVKPHRLSVRYSVLFTVGTSGKNLIIIIFCQRTVFCIILPDTQYYYLNFESIYT